MAYIHYMPLYIFKHGEKYQILEVKKYKHLQRAYTISNVKPVLRILYLVITSPSAAWWVETIACLSTASWLSGRYCSCLSVPLFCNCAPDPPCTPGNDSLCSSSWWEMRGENTTTLVSLPVQPSMGMLCVCVFGEGVDIAIYNQQQRGLNNL